VQDSAEGSALPNSASPNVDANIDKLLRTAIEGARVIQFRYQDRVRIAEPHDYGDQKGVAKLLAYQIGGSSSNPLPNWRSINVGEISDLRILDRTFPGGRPTPSGKHQKWDTLYIRVRAATAADA